MEVAAEPDNEILVPELGLEVLEEAEMVVYEAEQ
jgi:hypothetical protein